MNTPSANAVVNPGPNHGCTCNFGPFKLPNGKEVYTGVCTCGFRRRPMPPSGKIVINGPPFNPKPHPIVIRPGPGPCFPPHGGIVPPHIDPGQIRF